MSTALSEPSTEAAVSCTSEVKAGSLTTGGLPGVNLKSTVQSALSAAGCTRASKRLPRSARVGRSPQRTVPLILTVDGIRL